MNSNNCLNSKKDMNKIDSLFSSILKVKRALTMDHSNHPIFSEYDWETFTKAVSEMNSTEFYGETYPILSDYIDNYGWNKDIIIKFIIQAYQEESISYQKCLDDIIDYLLIGCRYAKDEIESDYSANEYLLERGAIIPEFKLLNPRYENESYAVNGDALESETYDYHIRGLLIDKFHDKMPHIDTYCDWSSIKSCYWEYIEDYENTSRLRYLKFCSEYLKTTFPNEDDNNEI